MGAKLVKSLINDQTKSLTSIDELTTYCSYMAVRQIGAADKCASSARERENSVTSYMFTAGCFSGLAV